MAEICVIYCFHKELYIRKLDENIDIRSLRQRFRRNDVVEIFVLFHKDSASYLIVLFVKCQNNGAIVQISEV